MTQPCAPSRRDTPGAAVPTAVLAALTATGGAQMPVASFPVETTGGVPVVAAPEEIDITKATELRAALLQAATQGDGTLVVDMSRTQFCDSAGLNVLVRAHKRAQAQGREMLLVISGDAVLRIFAV